MHQAVRAIIIEDNKLLLMHRNKEGSEYWTLVGGGVNEGETNEEALVREVMEETGLKVTKAQLVFIEGHPAPYKDQYIFLCEVAPHDAVGLQATSEESFMNKLGTNMHMPTWAYTNAFPRVPFRTSKLQNVIVEALENGFPDQPIKL